MIVSRSKEAALTHERLVELLDYDPETGIFTWRNPLRAGQFPRRNGGRAGSTLKNGRIIINFNGSIKGYGHIYAHRLAWFYVHGEWPSDRLDHINRDPTDNRIANLRECCEQQNSWNKGSYRSNTSGIKGVYWHKRLQKWQASVRRNFRLVHLGYFETKEEAAVVRAKAAQELHGEFYSGE